MWCVCRVSLYMQRTVCAYKCTSRVSLAVEFGASETSLSYYSAFAGSDIFTLTLFTLSEPYESCIVSITSVLWKAGHGGLCNVQGLKLCVFKWPNIIWIHSLMFAHISMHYVPWNAKRLYLSISQCSVRVRFVFLIVKVCTRDKVACGGWVVGGSCPTPETHPSFSLRLCLGFVLCRDKTHQASVCKTWQRGTDTLKTYHMTLIIKAGILQKRP